MFGCLAEIRLPSEGSLVISKFPLVLRLSCTLLANQNRVFFQVCCNQIDNKKFHRFSFF